MQVDSFAGIPPEKFQNLKIGIQHKDKIQILEAKREDNLILCELEHPKNQIPYAESQVLLYTNNEHFVEPHIKIVFYDFNVT